MLGRAGRLTGQDDGSDAERTAPSIPSQKNSSTAPVSVPPAAPPPTQRHRRLVRTATQSSPGDPESVKKLKIISKLALLLNQRLGGTKNHGRNKQMNIGYMRISTKDQNPDLQLTTSEKPDTCASFLKRSRERISSGLS